MQLLRGGGRGGPASPAAPERTTGEHAHRAGGLSLGTWGEGLLGLRRYSPSLTVFAVFTPGEG